MVVDLYKIITILPILSSLTGLMVEGLKKVFTKIPPNILVTITSIFLSILYQIGNAYVGDGFDFSVPFIMETIVLVVFGFLGATLGYDKVVQTIEQFKEKKDENDER